MANTELRLLICNWERGNLGGWILWLNVNCMNWFITLMPLTYNRILSITPPPIKSFRRLNPNMGRSYIITGGALYV